MTGASSIVSAANNRKALTRENNMRQETKGQFFDSEGREIIESPDDVTFVITKKDIEVAKRCDGRHCVIACGLSRSFGPLFIDAEVGIRVTKVYQRDTVIRFSTPLNLRRALKSFDEGDGWNLPPANYTLLAVREQDKVGYKSPEGPRRKSHGKRGKSGHRALKRRAPSRKVSKITVARTRS
jgi:hypothetical protein